MFKQLNVIELASVLAGPSVGQFFAELGAEVIKIENPKTKGDVTRSWKVKGETTEDISAYFSCTNWGKKSLTLDISKPEGRALLYKFVEQADIVITSYKPGDAQKLQVDYDSLKTIKQDIIYGEITGYGSENDRVGYDAIIQAESGFMHMNGQPDGPPTKMPVALMDVLAGHQLKEGILLAIIRRITTGEGSHVAVSLMDAALASLANQASNYLVAGEDPQRKGSSHPNIAPYGDIFLTKDKKRLLLAVGNDKQFNNLCQILDLRGLPNDEQYSKNQARVIHRSALNSVLAKRIELEESDKLMGRLSHEQIPAGIVQTVGEALNTDPAQGLLMSSSGFAGLKTIVAEGIGSKVSHILPPPGLGQHNHELLTEKLDLSLSEILDLEHNRVI